MLGSIEDNPNEFKLNVHNIFTVCLSRPVELFQSITITSNMFVHNYLYFCIQLLILQKTPKIASAGVVSVLRTSGFSKHFEFHPLEPGTAAPADDVDSDRMKQTHFLIASQTMSLLWHVALSRLNRKVAVPNLLSRKTAVVRNERRLIEEIVVAKTSNWTFVRVQIIKNNASRKGGGRHNCSPYFNMYH